jgi:hypothetical protein
LTVSPWFEIWYPTLSLSLGDIPLVCDQITYPWPLFGRPTCGSCRVTYLCVWKTFRIFHEWFLFGQPTHGLWSCNLPMISIRATYMWFVTSNLLVVWKISRIFHKWSLFGWPNCGLWSGNLLVVWKIFMIFHEWSLFGRLLVVHDQVTYLWFMIQ